MQQPGRLTRGRQGRGEAVTHCLSKFFIQQLFPHSPWIPATETSPRVPGTPQALSRLSDLPQAGHQPPPLQMSFKNPRYFFWLPQAGVTAAQSCPKKYNANHIRNSKFPSSYVW